MGSITTKYDHSSLSVDQKAQVLDFIKKALRGENATWPNTVQVILYIGNEPKWVKAGRWRNTGSELQIGQTGGAEENIGSTAKLGILMALMKNFGFISNPELLGMWSDRLSKLLIGLYKDAIETITESEVPVSRLAFTETVVLAEMNLGDGVSRWFRPNGEELPLPEDAMVVEAA